MPSASDHQEDRRPISSIAPVDRLKAEAARAIAAYEAYLEHVRITLEETP